MSGGIKITDRRAAVTDEDEDRKPAGGSGAGITLGSQTAAPSHPAPERGRTPGERVAGGRAGPRQSPGHAHDGAPRFASPAGSGDAPRFGASSPQASRPLREAKNPDSGALHSDGEGEDDLEGMAAEEEEVRSSSTAGTGPRHGMGPGGGVSLLDLQRPELVSFFLSIAMQRAVIALGMMPAPGRKGPARDFAEARFFIDLIANLADFMRGQWGEPMIETQIEQQLTELRLTYARLAPSSQARGGNGR